MVDLDAVGETRNYGLLGGKLTPPPPSRFVTVESFVAFVMLARLATKLVGEGYHLEANKVIDVLLDWRETGAWPKPFEVAGEHIGIGYTPMPDDYFGPTDRDDDELDDAA